MLRRFLLQLLVKWSEGKSTAEKQHAEIQLFSLYFVIIYNYPSKRSAIIVLDRALGRAASCRLLRCRAVFWPALAAPSWWRTERRNPPFVACIL